MLVVAGASLAQARRISCEMGFIDVAAELTVPPSWCSGVLG